MVSATEALFKDHRQSVDGIQERIQKFSEHGLPFRVVHGYTNTTRPTSFSRSSVVDVSHMDHVLHVDPEANTCLVQPNVDMWTLVNATLEEDRLPPVVPPFPGITVGGAFNGTAGDSSSWKRGFFDRCVKYIQVILADGRIVHCGPNGSVKVPPIVFGGDTNQEKSPAIDNENEEKLIEMGGGVAKELSNDDLRELYYASIGSYGTLGVTTMFCLSLNEVEDGSYVYLSYERVKSPREAVAKIQAHIDEVNGGAYEKSGNSDEAPQFIDSIVFDKEHAVVMTGRIVAPDAANHIKWKQRVWVHSFARPWNKWFYLRAEQQLKKIARKEKMKHINEPKADLIPVRQYLFRYDVAGFWMGKEAMALLRWPYNRITRTITYPFVGTRTLKGALQLSGAAGKYILQDLIMPADSLASGASHGQAKSGTAANPIVIPSADPEKKIEVPADDAGVVLDQASSPLDSKERLAQGLGINMESKKLAEPERDATSRPASSQGSAPHKASSGNSTPRPSTSHASTAPPFAKIEGKAFRKMSRAEEAASAPVSHKGSTAQSVSGPSSTTAGPVAATETAPAPSKTPPTPSTQDASQIQPTTTIQDTSTTSQPTETTQATTTKPVTPPLNPTAPLPATSTASSETLTNDTTPQEAPVIRMLDYLESSLGIYPLWLCPIRGQSPAPMHQHAPALTATEPPLLINIGAYGPPATERLNKFLPNNTLRGYDPSNHVSRMQWIADNREIENKVHEYGGKKWLYAQTFYKDEGKFYEGLGLRKEEVEEVRAKFGAGSIPGLWEKLGHKVEVEETGALHRTWGLLAIFGFNGLLTWA